MYGNDNKMITLQEGIGQDNPDRESFIKLKFLLRVNGKILYNGFDSDSLKSFDSDSQQIHGDFLGFKN